MKLLNKTVRILLLGALAFSGVVSAQEVDLTKPYDMIQTVAQNLFARLESEQSQIRANPELLKGVVEDELMPYVNYKYSALKLLGPNLRGAKKEDVGVFIESFRHYLISSYAQVLTLYSDQKVMFEPAKPLGDQRIISIKVTIVDAPRPDINIEFKLRKDKKDDSWLAFDMVTEGISLLSSKQSEWSQKIRQDGIPSVAKELEKIAANPIRFEGQDKS